jgi:hypothetical protein
MRCQISQIPGTIIHLRHLICQFKTTLIAICVRLTTQIIGEMLVNDLVLEKEMIEIELIDVIDMGMVKFKTATVVE